MWIVNKTLAVIFKRYRKTCVFKGETIVLYFVLDKTQWTGHYCMWTKSQCVVGGCPKMNIKETTSKKIKKEKS